MYKTTSKFIETPTKKLARFEDDFTVNPIEDFENGDGPPPGSHEGHYIRYDIKVWQDEVSMIPKDTIIERFKSAGAIDVDIRIIRIPRETVRSESVLKVNTLREKLVAMAELRGETVSESVLEKADLLEFGERKEQVAA